MPQTAQKTLNPDLLAAMRRHGALVAADGDVPASIVDNRLQQDRLAPHWAEGAPDMAQTHDLTVPGPRGARAARLYRPHRAESGAVILFLHGGGWARGTIATGEWPCRALAAESRLAVLSLAYSLAPEHPFPAGLDDVVAAIDWLAATPARRSRSGSASSTATTWRPTATATTAPANTACPTPA